ncbi:MAG: HNH endonuclease signature motif containing protein [Pseudomonadota bacterium]
MARGLRRIHHEILRVLREAGVGVEVSKECIDAGLPNDLQHQSDLPRRIRELRSNGGYSIPVRVGDGTSYYTLESLDQREQVADPSPIPGKLRAKILLQANGRCQLSGQTIKEDGIKLVVDHRIPREWGGTTDEENLWAISETCNIQKKDYFATLPSNIMARCMGFDEPVQRIGELLKAKQGEIVPRWLLSAVGMEEEWTRRLRELRDLGWDVETVRVKGERGAARFSYRLRSSKPWPDDVRQAIRDAAKKRGSKSL